MGAKRIPHLVRNDYKDSPQSKRGEEVPYPKGQEKPLKGTSTGESKRGGTKFQRKRNFLYQPIEREKKKYVLFLALV